VQAPWGEVNAHVFYLRPGIGFVYIEANAPHRSEDTRKIGFDPDQPMGPVWAAQPADRSGGPSGVLKLKHELFRLPRQG
jgi:hypothetical protein